MRVLLFLFFLFFLLFFFFFILSENLSWSQVWSGYRWEKKKYMTEGEVCLDTFCHLAWPSTVLYLLVPKNLFSNISKLISSFFPFFFPPSSFLLNKSPILLRFSFYRWIAVYAYFFLGRNAHFSQKQQETGQCNAMWFLTLLPITWGNLYLKQKTKTLVMSGPNLRLNQSLDGGVWPAAFFTMSHEILIFS